MKNIEGKVLYKPKSGVTLLISPPTLTLRNALHLEVLIQYPDPDPASYARASNTPVLGEQGMALTDGKDNPDYKNDLAEVKIKRVSHLETMLLQSCVDSLHDRDNLIESYRERLTALRVYTTLVPDNNWEAVLKCFIAEQDELNVIRQILSRNLPLTEEEVADGRKFFRVELPGDGLRNVHPGEQPPDHRAAQPRQDERLNGRGGSGKGVGNRSRSRR